MVWSWRGKFVVQVLPSTAAVTEIGLTTYWREGPFSLEIAALAAEVARIGA